MEKNFEALRTSRNKEKAEPDKRKTFQSLLVQRFDLLLKENAEDLIKIFKQSSGWP